MKKILAVAMALVMVVSMCVGVSALDESKKTLMPQVWIQDTNGYTWVEAKPAGATEAPHVALGETVDVVLTNFDDYSKLDMTSGCNGYGFQICDETLSTETAGDSSTIGFTVSDMTFKADGYDDIVVPIAGSYTKDIKTVQYDWGVGDNNANFNSEVTAAISAVVGTDAKAIFDYFSALTSISYTITYDSYNGETAAPAAETETPAETEAPAETTAETEAPADAPAETEAPASTPAPEAPKTGLALAVVPAVMALAAVAVSKKH